MKTRLAMIIAPVILGAGLALAMPATAEAGSGHYGSHYDSHHGSGHYKGRTRGHYRDRHRGHYKYHGRGHRKAHYRGHRKGHFRGYRKGYRHGRRAGHYRRHAPRVRYYYPYPHGEIRIGAPGIGIHLYID